MTPEEQRIADIEERVKRIEGQRIPYPLDYNSQRSLFYLLNRTVVDLLRPQETAAANEGTSTLLNNTPCIQFADAATGEAYFSVVPMELDIVSMEFVWSTPATSGNLRCQIDIGEGGDSEANNVRTTGGTAVSVAADGTANDLNFTDILNGGFGVSVGKLKRNLWGIKFSRIGADAADTLSNTVNLYGILLRYNLYA